MQQQTTRQLYAYWDTLRNGRIAPRRSEIDPCAIADLLRETYMAEHERPFRLPFRLAGTRICSQFGRELRGIDFLSLWSIEDRNTIGSLVRAILDDNAVGHGTFSAKTETGREAAFEFSALPVIHGSAGVDRILGAITAIEPPYWLGGEPLTSFELSVVRISRRGRILAKIQGSKPVRKLRKRLRVIEGGLSQTG